MRKDQGAADEREQCGAHPGARHCGWRHTRAVLRYDGDIQNWWAMPRYKLPFSGYAAHAHYTQYRRRRADSLQATT